MEKPKAKTEMTPGPLFLTEAEGTIQAGEHQKTRLTELKERIKSTEFYKAAEAAIATICIDGRGGDGLRLLPNSAGATLSAVVADDLTQRRFAAEDGTTVGAFKNVLNHLQGRNLPIGAHTDDHAHGEAGGCGASDKLQQMYDFIGRKPELLEGLAVRLGLKVPSGFSAGVAEKARSRQEFSTGAEIFAEAKNRKGDVTIEELQGAHNEVAVVINTQAGTTLDRRALQAEFGEEYQIFNVDVWAFEETARSLGAEQNPLTEQEVQELVLALAYYNLAAAHVLGGPGLEVIVR